MANESLIEINSAKVFYGGKHLFENLNFRWEKGQHWAIIGDSGDELSAFLETIRGNTVIASGEVLRPFSSPYLEQKNKKGEVHSFRDLVSYVSQKYELKNRSNQQNFYFQQRFNSNEAEETSTVREYLLQVTPKVDGPWTLQKTSGVLNLSHLLDTSLLKLSNGETRRLVLALGLMRQPKIYLMDHPTTGLDAQTRREFGNILKQIIQTGVHLLITTSPEEIPDPITHVAKVNASGIVQTWAKGEHTQQVHRSKPLAWDWNLLKQLLPAKGNPKESIIQLQDVTIRYGEKNILSQLNWEIMAGERWLLKGPNGAGKSTLLSLLIGENPQAYSQNIFLFGRKRGSGESIWDVKRPIGFVAPELSRFFPSNQTCRKVILSGFFDTMGLFKKPNPEQESKAAHWLALFDLQGVKDWPIARLSLAQQRWTLLARALIKEPKLLILDEASQGLDDSQRLLFKSTLEKICELTSISLIYVSHYEADVPEAFDRIKELNPPS